MYNIKEVKSVTRILRLKSNEESVHFFDSELLPIYETTFSVRLYTVFIMEFGPRTEDNISNKILYS